MEISKIVEGEEKAERTIVSLIFDLKSRKRVVGFVYADQKGYCVGNEEPILLDELNKQTKRARNQCEICQTEIRQKSKMCRQCSVRYRKEIEIPEYYVLLQLLEQHTRPEIAKLYDISQNTLDRWLSHYRKKSRQITQ